MQKVIAKEKPKRAFGGKTENFKDKEERNREKKHLKAYLKGQRYFFHGFEETITGRKSIRYVVINQSI